MVQRYIKYGVFLIVFCWSLFPLYSQEDGRKLLRGQVLYMNTNVPDENVINTTTESATITNDRGEFAIRVKEGDELVFTAVNYQLMVVDITPEIVKKNRLVIEVNEKITELDEVVVTPEDQQEFLRLKNEKFKEYEYEVDPTAEVVNIAQDQSVRGMRDGLNFVNIFKALSKAGRGNNPQTKVQLKVSEVLRKVYEDEFFVVDLKIPQGNIDDFLIYVDDKIPAYTLLQNDNEFQLIDFLVTHSKAYLKELNGQE